MRFLNIEGRDGYIKLWRKLQDWSVWKLLNWNQRGVLISILWAANWRDRTQYKPGEGFVVIERGSFLCTISELARYAEVSIKTVRTTIEHLANQDDKKPFIRAISVANRCTLITVINYEVYQGDPGDLGQAIGQAIGQTGGQTDPPIPYSKKIKKNKKKSAAPVNDLLTIAPEAWHLADLHRELLLKHDPESSCGGPRWSKQRWAKAYDSGQRTTCSAPLPWDYIEKVLTWALDGSEQWSDGRHWRDFLTTPGKFFSKWDTLRRQHLQGTADELEMDPNADDWTWDYQAMLDQER